MLPDEQLIKQPFSIRTRRKGNLDFYLELFSWSDGISTDEGNTRHILEVHPINFSAIVE